MLARNHSWPPSLKPTSLPQKKKTEVIIIDGSALVHTLPPKRRKTFEDYAALDVLPSIHAYAMKYKSTNIVFDVYNPSSLKMETRSK